LNSLTRLVVVSLIGGAGGTAVQTLAAAVAAAPQASGRAVTAVPSVDLDRYAGQWFEVARYPNYFQRNCTGNVTATYVRRADGKVDVINRCRAKDGTTTEAKGLAKIDDAKTRSKLRVRFAPAVLSFLPFVWGDYWVIGLAEDYSWAVVGTPNRKYLWILARTATMSDELYAQAAGVAEANGFDTSRLVRTPQRP
jgi:apolipoprotein D and lipocalin family protein